MKILKQTILTTIIVCLSVLWLKEISLRRAIQETSNFMEPFAHRSKDRWAITYHKLGIITVVGETGNLSQTLGWIIGYEPDELRNGLNVNANLFGDVVWVSDGYVNDIIKYLKAGDKEKAKTTFEEMEPI